MTDPLLWFRVETDGAGKVLSVTLVESAGDDSRRVFFVKALDEGAAEAAGKIAFNAYYRKRQRAHRAKLRSEGRCDCGRALDAGGKVCKFCRKRSRLYDARAEAKKRGEVVQPLSRKETRDARRFDEAAAFRREILEEVDRKWRELGTLKFRIWLRRQIAGFEVAS